MAVDMQHGGEACESQALEMGMGEGRPRGKGGRPEHSHKRMSGILQAGRGGTGLTGAP